MMDKLKNINKISIHGDKNVSFQDIDNSEITVNLTDDASIKRLIVINKEQLHSIEKLINHLIKFKKQYISKTVTIITVSKIVIFVFFLSFYTYITIAFYPRIKLIINDISGSDDIEIPTMIKIPSGHYLIGLSTNDVMEQNGLIKIYLYTMT